MGAEQSVPGGIVKQKKFTIIGIKENNIYGPFKLIESSGVRYALVTRNCPTYQEYCSLSAKLNQARSLNNIPNALRLLEVDTYEESNLCSTFYRVSAVYEFHERTLRDLASFSLPQLKSLVQTLCQFYHHGSHHGSINPDYILINQNGDPVINNVQAMTNFTHFKRVLIQQSEGPWYVAPEMLDAIQRKDLRPQFDWEKADTFSLGLTLLELWNNCDVQLFYNKADLTINNYAIDSALDEFAAVYGSIYRQILKQMLQFDARLRPTFSELNQYLQPLQEQTEPSEATQTTAHKEPFLDQQHESFQPHYEPLHLHIQVGEGSDGEKNDYSRGPEEHPLNESKPEHLEFQESPAKKPSRRGTTHKRTDSENVPVITQPINKPMIPQSPKDYYVSGSISAQFQKSNDYSSQQVATAFFQESLEALQERCTNQLSQQSASVVKEAKESQAQKKKPTKGAVAAPAKKNVSIKRPKHEQAETKLPKQAVVVPKRR